MMNDSLFRLTGQRALITGGSRGIGLGIAHAMAKAGAELVLVSRDEAALGAAKQALQVADAPATTIVCDLQQPESVSRCFGQIVDECGAVDILVNCAGITRRGPAETLSQEDWQAVMDVNLTSMFRMCQAFAQHRIPTGQGGRVINIGSVMCAASRPGTAAYSASKGGVLMLTKALAVDWACHGILVNAIGPGYIRTDLTELLVNDPPFDAWVRQRCPLKRWGTPEDIAGAAVFLASPAASFITGQILYVDGGWLAAV